MIVKTMAETMLIRTVVLSRAYVSTIKEEYTRMWNRYRSIPWIRTHEGVERVAYLVVRSTKY